MSIDILMPALSPTMTEGNLTKWHVKKGDLIKSINGKSINDIYEYMDRLGELKPGMNIPVQIERNGNIIELSVTL